LISGIYAIICLINDKMYIGSANNLSERWKQHKCRLTVGDHHNKHLQNAWNKYWKHNFIFVILERTNNLIEREQYWIDLTNCCNKNIGYNKRIIAESNAGYKCSEETKRKISVAQKGIPRPNTKRLNFKHSEESKLKMSISNKGRKASLNALIALEIGRGKKSEETKRKIAMSLKGQKHTEERRKAISDGRWNKKVLAIISVIEYDSNGNVVQTQKA
jgi:group I intron endonuclease